MNDRTASAALELRQIKFGYESADPVIEQIDVDLRVGRLTVLVGPNAAGKSTLLKLMLGQLEPWSGEVSLSGCCVTSLRPKERAVRISYVPQRGASSFLFTVRQIVEMGCFAQGAGTRNFAAVDEAARLCDLVKLQDRIFAHLSVGQQQRVLVARAIAQSRGSGCVMLLDEPTGGMDLKHVHRLMQILRQLAQEGLAVLAVLHDLNLAARYANDVWLMDRGRMVAAGPWDQVLQTSRLEEIYDVRLVAVTPPVSKRDAASERRPAFFVEPMDIMDRVV